LVEEDERSPARFSSHVPVTDTTRTELLLARGLPARLRDPRRLTAILLLALIGGVVLAFLWARGQLAGSDALAYWTGVQRWLAGQDIYQVIPGLYVPPTEGALPYAYAPWSLYVFLPWALLPWDIAWVGWRLANFALFAASVAWAWHGPTTGGHWARQWSWRCSDRRLRPTSTRATSTSSSR
jgi:hypothetical protein